MTLPPLHSVASKKSNSVEPTLNPTDWPTSLMPEASLLMELASRECDEFAATPLGGGISAISHDLAGAIDGVGDTRASQVDDFTAAPLGAVLLLCPTTCPALLMALATLPPRLVILSPLHSTALPGLLLDE